MDIRDRNGLMRYAEEALGSASYSPRKLMLLHSAVGIGASLLVSLINFLLARQIDTTGGLSSLGLRTVLATVQLLLQYGIVLVLPFWEQGIFYSAMRTARNQPAGPNTLLRGFRRCGPVFRAYLLQAVIYYGAALISAYVIICAVAMMPWLVSYMMNNVEQTVLLEIIGNIPEPETIFGMFSMEQIAFSTEASTQLLEAVVQANTAVVAVIMGISCLVVGVVYILISYTMRMMPYLVLDEEKCGAFAALRMSNQMTKGWKMELFKLDLRFWWYYALQAVLLALCYVPELLGLASVPMPISGDEAFWLFYVLYAVAQLVLYVLARPKVETVFAAAYDSLRTQE